MLIKITMPVPNSVIVGASLLIIFFVLLFLILVPLNLYFDIRYNDVHYGKSNALTETKIPSIVHQTWKTNELLDFQTQNRENFISKLGLIEPDLQFPLYTDRDFDEFVETHYDWFLPTWNKLSPFIKKVDTIRYMWLHKYGGIYLDLDVRLISPDIFGKLLLSPRREKTLIVTANSSFAPFVLTGPVLMAAHPGHEFFLRMLHYITRHYDTHVLNATGPVAMSNCLRSYLKASTEERNHHVHLISSSLAGVGPGNFLVKSMTKHDNSGLWKKRYK